MGASGGGKVSLPGWKRISVDRDVPLSEYILFNLALKESGKLTTLLKEKKKKIVAVQIAVKLGQVRGYNQS